MFQETGGFQDTHQHRAQESWEGVLVYRLFILNDQQHYFKGKLVEEGYYPYM